MQTVQFVHDKQVPIISSFVLILNVTARIHYGNLTLKRFISKYMCILIYHVTSVNVYLYIFSTTIHPNTGDPRYKSEMKYILTLIHMAFSLVVHYMGRGKNTPHPKIWTKGAMNV